jgi:hypothetical protein
MKIALKVFEANGEGERRNFVFFDVVIIVNNSSLKIL